MTSRPMRPRTLFGGLVIGAFVASCSLAPGSGGTPGIQPSRVPETSSAPVGEVPQRFLDAVISGAAQRAGVSPADVEIVAAEAVTWNDGALGCPEPGKMYTQALVPGYRVVVEAGGEEMSFHSGRDGDFRFCERPAPGAWDAGA
jgi:hypothetical protein